MKEKKTQFLRLSKREIKRMNQIAILFGLWKVKIKKK